MNSIIFTVYPLDDEMHALIGQAKTFFFNVNNHLDISWHGSQYSEIHISIAKALNDSEELWKRRQIDWTVNH